MGLNFVIFPGGGLSPPPLIERETRIFKEIKGNHGEIMTESTVYNDVVMGGVFFDLRISSILHF